MFTVVKEPPDWFCLKTSEGRGFLTGRTPELSVGETGVGRRRSVGVRRKFPVDVSGGVVS